MDLLEIGPVHACEMAFKIDEAVVEHFQKQIVLLQNKKERKKVFEACGKKKKLTAFKSKETHERMRSDIRTSGCPVYTCPKSTGTSG